MLLQLDMKLVQLANVLILLLLVLELVKLAKENMPLQLVLLPVPPANLEEALS